MVKSILVATDFSTRSDRALRRATLAAKEWDASLSLVHVIDNDQPERVIESERATASAVLLECAQTLREVNAVECSTWIVVEDPFRGIVKAAEDLVPDLLVIGPHRRQALDDVFVGTTAERTVRASPVQVLMANGVPATAYRLPPTAMS